MSDPPNIDPSLRDFIKDEADRARGEAIADTDRLRRDFKVAGIVITPLLALATFFGIPTLINNAVEKAMKEYAIKEVSERAEEISKNLEETNDKAGMLLNNITEAANKVAEEKRLFLEEFGWSGHRNSSLPAKLTPKTRNLFLRDRSEEDQIRGSHSE